ncbi:hypothetical protein D0B54_11935 [Solimonas sp. K1W22B-7]|uniref:hypothetical protein n=1 Tax=Solimonas sp. K1W22B-7 TaxID=2303331 RepID=UPI000E32E9F0|nr:hypothetical protein [Solimonas sp. K1W22B-7]AXQ29359.1 hypothetical protein D0B54_11935 [Solimonas sp. K1W22B-7]
MKQGIERSGRLLVGRALLVAGLMAGSAQAAEPVAAVGPAAALQRCLGDLAGVNWQWPYLPRLSVSRCISPAGSYNATASIGSSGKERMLGLTAQGGLNHVYADDVLIEESFADMQNAVFLHFDQLLRSQGFTKLAEVRNGAATRGGSYRRQSAESNVTVVFSADGANDWSFSFDVAAAPAAAGVTP